MSTKPRRIEVEHSAVFLPPESDLRRHPKAPGRRRPPAFFEAFEDRALYYDAFWHVDGERVLLVGPPSLNLGRALAGARFHALPSNTPAEPRTFASWSVMVTALAVPAGTEALSLQLGPERWEIPVRPNLSARFAGARVIGTINRDNELAWIDEWARFHARRHGADAVVMFDNGSETYSRGELEACLLAVPGLKSVAVVSWPYRFGPVDPAVVNNPFWPRFLQISAFSVLLRRFCAGARGLLNCDIDELVAPGPATVFEAASASRWGLVRFKGRWVPPLAAPDAPASGLTHRNYPFRYRGAAGPKPSDGKWALDPTRDWVADLGVHPYWHWIEGRPWRARRYDGAFFYWHFQAINTGWKDRRADAGAVDPSQVERDPQLAACWERP